MQSDKFIQTNNNLLLTLAVLADKGTFVVFLIQNASVQEALRYATISPIPDTIYQHCRFELIDLLYKYDLIDFNFKVASFLKSCIASFIDELSIIEMLNNPEFIQHLCNLGLEENNNFINQLCKSQCIKSWDMIFNPNNLKTANLRNKYFDTLENWLFDSFNLLTLDMLKVLLASQKAVEFITKDNNFRRLYKLALDSGQIDKKKLLLDTANLTELPPEYREDSPPNYAEYQAGRASIERPNARPTSGRRRF